MLDYVNLVMFAIYAAMRLGQKAVAVYGDEVRDRELILPPVEVDSPEFRSWPETQKFFSGDGKAFVAEGGLYEKWWQDREGQSYAQVREKLCIAYSAIKKNIGPIQQADDLEGFLRRNPEQFYSGTYALLRVKQWRDGTDPKPHPVQRLAGTVVELALDYVKLDPTLFGGSSQGDPKGDRKGDQLLRSFLLSLDEVKFSEAHFDDLLVDIAQASLNTFKNQVDLVVSEEALRPLFKNLSETLADELQKVKDSNEPDKLLAFNRMRREVLEHLIGTTAAAVSGYPAAFLGTSRGEQLLKGVLQAMLTSVQNNPDLFSSSAIQSIYGAGLRAAAQNAALLLPDGQGGASIFLTSLVSALAQKLADTAASSPASLLNLEILPELSEIALGVLSQNARSLINPQKPEQQLLVDALERVSLALSADFHNNPDLPALMQHLMSRDNTLDLLQEVFGAVARCPEGLLPGVGGDAARSALAQIVGSVAATASQDTRSLLNGEGFVKLLGVALQAFAKNPDRLLDLNLKDPKQNIMAQVMTAVLTSAAKNLEAGGRNLLTGDTLMQLMDAALAAVSQNTAGFKKEPDIVAMVMDRLLYAASHPLANELDAQNLLAVFAPVLRQALKGREVLDQSDSQLILPLLAGS